MKFFKKRKLEKLIKKRKDLKNQLKFCSEAEKSFLTGELESLQRQINELESELETPKL